MSTPYEDRDCETLRPVSRTEALRMVRRDAEDRRKAPRETPDRRLTGTQVPDKLGS